MSKTKQVHQNQNQKENQNQNQNQKQQQQPSSPSPSLYQGEPGKIVIALGREPANLKLKDDLDIIMLKNPVYLKRYNRNRSLLLMDVIRNIIQQNKQFL